MAETLVGNKTSVLWTFDMTDIVMVDIIVPQRERLKIDRMFYLDIYRHQPAIMDQSQNTEATAFYLL